MPDPTHRLPIKADRASVERLAGALDALVTGTTPSPSDDVALARLATAAKRIQRIDGVVHTPAGPLPASPIDAAHRNQIWEDLMKTSPRPAPASSTGSARALLVTALNPWVAEAEPASRWDQIAGPRRRASTSGVLRFAPDIQPLTTFLMVIALLVAIGAGFSSLGQTGGPGDSPTAAATGDRGIVAQGSPEADAGIDAPFLHPVQATDCTVEPRPLEEVAAFLRDPGPVSQRAYLPATNTVEPAAAVDAVETGRAYAACGNKGQSYTRAIETPRKIHEDSHNSFSNAASGRLSIAEEKALSEALLDPDPRSYFIPSEEILTTPQARAASDAGKPDQIQQTMLPSHMVQLADGRIGGPIHWLIRPEAADLPQNVDAPADQDWATVQFLIFAPDASRGGQWAVDESLWLCAGDCDADWVLDAQLDPATPTAAACPAATLTSDQIATIRTGQSSLPDRQYAPVTTADVPTASAVRSASDLIAECIEAIGTDQTRLFPLMTDRYAREIMMGMAPIGPVESSRAISMHYGDTLLGNEPSPEELDLYLNISTTRKGGQNINPGIVGATDSRPQIVRLLPDGRAALYSADVWLHRAGTIQVPGAVPGQEVFSYTIFANQNGDWLLDEHVMVCLGDCDDYWAELAAPKNAPGPRHATPVATPAAITRDPA